MLTTPIMRMVASNSRELTKPIEKPRFWRLMTAYSATAVPMAVRLLTMSKRAPRRTWSALALLMMKVGIVEDRALQEDGRDRARGT